MADPKKVEIEINTRATGDGADAAARGIEQAGNAAENAGKKQHKGKEEAEGLGEAFAKLGGRGNGAREALEGLEHASNGGAGAIFGLAKAFKGLFEIGASASPFSAILTGIAALIAVGTLVKEKFFDPAEEGLKKTGEEAEKTAEKLTEFEQLQLEFDKQKKQLGELADEFELVRQKAEAAFNASQKISDAKAAEKVSAIRLKEQQALNAAGGDENKKKEISAKADVEVTNVQKNSEIEGLTKQFGLKTSEATSLQNELQQYQKKEGDAIQAHADAQRKIDDDRKKAAALGLKSDQESALDELEELKKKSAASEEKGKKNQAELASNIDNGDGGVAAFKLAAEETKRATEENQRQVRIRQLESDAPKYRAKIAANEEEYTGTSEREAGNAKRAQEAFDKDKTPENANLLSDAKARAEAASNLAKDVPAAEKQVIHFQETIDDSRKKIGEIRTALESTKADAEVLKAKIGTVSNERDTALAKVQGDVESHNRTITEKNQSGAAEQAARDAQTKAIDDQILHSEDLGERQKLQAQRDALKGTPTQAETPLINVDTSVRTEKPKPKRPVFDPDADPTDPIAQQILKPRGTITTADGRQQHLQDEGGLPTSAESDGGQAKVVADAKQAVDQIRQQTPPPLPVDQLVQAVQLHGDSVVKLQAKNSQALQTMAATLQEFAGKFDAQAAQIDQLTSQVASLR